MTTTRRQIALGERYGFEHFKTDGLVGLARTHPDGRRQLANMFRWGGFTGSSHKHADAGGNPHFYAVICPALDAPAESTRAEDGRIIIPFVEWPSMDQTPRPWADVVAEFGEVLMPIFDAPIAMGQEMLDSLGERYQLKPHQF